MRRIHVWFIVLIALLVCLVIVEYIEHKDKPAKAHVKHEWEPPEIPIPGSE